MTRPKTLGALGVLLAIIGGIFYYNASLNFGFLGVLMCIVAAGLPWLYHQVLHRRLLSGQPLGMEAVALPRMLAIVLLACGWLCTYTLDNYFTPSPDVYRNVDHHVLRLDGCTFSQPERMLLAAPSGRALFDADHTQGRIVIAQVTDSSVMLDLAGFTEALYACHLRGDYRCDSLTLLDTRSLLHLSEAGAGPDDTLRLRMKDGSLYRLYVETGRRQRPWWKVWQSAADSVSYHLLAPSGDESTSDEHRLIVRGLPLSRLLRGTTADDIDFSALHLVRPTAYLQARPGQRRDALRRMGYAIEVRRVVHEPDDNYVTHISTDGHTWRPTEADRPEAGVAERVEIPFGQNFSLSYGGTATPTACFTREAGLTLRLLQPMRRHLTLLPGQTSGHTLVTTSLTGLQDHLDDVPNDITLFDLFDHADNAFNLTPLTLSFTASATDTLLSMQCQPAALASGGPRRAARIQPLNAGEALQGTRAVAAPGVTWMLQVEDLKQTSPYQPQSIRWHIWLMAVLMAFSLTFCGAGRARHGLDQSRNSFTTVEFAAAVATLYLLTLRWFLLWRTATFPPVTHVSRYEWEGLFRDPSGGMWVTWLPPIAVALVAVAKLSIAQRCLWPWPMSTGRWLDAAQTVADRWAGWWQQAPRWWATLGVAGGLMLVAVIMAVVLKGRPPSLYITVPVLAYLTASALITRLCFSPYDAAAPEGRSQWAGARMMFLSVACSLSFGLCLSVVDSGFGILFMTFAAFWTLWQLREYVTHDVADSDYSRWQDCAVVVLFAGLLALIGGYRDVIGYVFYNPLPAMLCLATVGAGVVWCVGRVIIGLRPTWRLWTTVLAVAGLCAVVPWAGRWYLTTSSQHTVQRIAVHFHDPDKVMRDIRDAGSEYRYLQAAHNHFIIGEYDHRADDVSLFGEHGHGYFKMQPHSTFGAMWNAQLTDISAVRYVIAEHSRWLPVLAIVLFLLMLTWGMRQPCRHRWARTLAIQIPLLLMLQSLLIWMTVTRRFIFLGQDFPMLSVHSKLTVIYYFALMVLWLVAACYNQAEPAADEADDVGGLLRRFETPRKDARIIFTLAVCVLGLAIASQSRSITPSADQARDGAAEPRAEQFSVHGMMRDFVAQISVVNERLRQYQEDRTLTTRHPELARYVRLEQGGAFHSFVMQHDLHAFIAAFDADVVQPQRLFAGSGFAQRVWSEYVADASHYNHLDLLLHARLDRSHHLQLQAITYYYTPTLPQPLHQQWRGSLISPRPGPSADQPHVATSSGLSLFRLPAAWMADGRETLIASSSRHTVTCAAATFAMEGIRSAVACGSDVSLHPAPAPTLRALMPQPNYLARGLTVNGNRTFFYPLGRQSFWLHTLAEEVKKQREAAGRPAGDAGAHWDDDVELTLSPTLIAQLHAIVDRPSGSGRSRLGRHLIVADGDGAVWAMVSGGQTMTLDPNDTKGLRRFMDWLELHGEMGTDKERQTLGNGCLMAIASGPGSTQKPLVWTAVASRIEYPWRSLRIHSYDGHIASEGNKFRIEQWGGRQMLPNNPFKPLWNDEQDGATITLRGYMTQSSNVYNAVMAHIGSFTEADLRQEQSLTPAPQPDGTALWARYRQPASGVGRDFRAHFPIMTDGTASMAFDRPLRSDDQPVCLLHESMAEMFFRSDTADMKRGLRRRYDNAASTLLRADDSDRHNGYAYVETSHFDPRSGATSGELLELAIRSTAIGARRVWYVTPWKMAESYARMASLNANLHLSVVRREPQAYQPFSDLSSGYLDARPDQMLGMSDVLTVGTAHSMSPHLGIRRGREGQSHSVDGYYIYAKTGTIGENDHDDKHRLAVIIADHDLADRTTELSQLRYVVLYFTFPTKGGWEAYADAIKAVMASPEFARYMQGRPRSAP